MTSHSYSDIVKWLYLSKVHIPTNEAKVNLLIRANATKLLEPWEVINSLMNGPDANKTVLGWMVNGLLHGSSSVDKELPSAMGNRIAVCKLE